MAISRGARLGNFPSSFSDYYRTALTRAEANREEAAIQDLRATTDTVLHWYYAQDPIDEERHFRSMLFIDGAGNFLPDEFIKVQAGEDARSFTYEAAAVTLLGRMLKPEFFDDPETPPHEKFFVALRHRQPDLSGNPPEAVSVVEVLNHLTDLLKNSQLTADEMRQASIAGDMVNHASSYNDGLAKMTQQKMESGQPISYGDLNMQGFFNPSERQRALSFVYRHIFLKIGEEAALLHEQTGELEAASLHLQTMLRLSSAALGFTESGRRTPEQIVERMPILGHMIDVAKLYFTGPDCLQYRFRENASFIRGLLHEYMWFLDVNLLLHAEGDTRISIRPAHSFEDAPKVGFPERNRGFDFLISVLGGINGWESYAVNLKSRPQSRFEKTYHPVIRQLKEKNLQDYNPRSLASKLDKYGVFLEQAGQVKGFKQGIEPVKKQLLESVIDEYDFINSVNDNHYTPEATQSVQEISSTTGQLALSGAFGLNRQQRRKHAKITRKKKNIKRRKR